MAMAAEMRVDAREISRVSTMIPTTSGSRVTMSWTAWVMPSMISFIDLPPQIL